MSFVEAADVLANVNLEAGLVSSLRTEQFGGTAASELLHSFLTGASSCRGGCGCS